MLILFCRRALDAWRRLHGHPRVILTTNAATLVDRSADDIIRVSPSGECPPAAAPFFTVATLDGLKIKAACPLASPAAAHA